MAQGVPADGLDTAGSAGRGGFDPAASAGLFVGVSKFEDERIVEVPFAVDDAVDLAHLFILELGLVTSERAVLLLAGEPRKAESVARLEALRQSGARFATARQRDIYRHLTELVESVRPRGMALLSVATHGVSDAGGDFLVATDSLADRKLRTGVSVSEVFEEASRTGRGLVLLDACREQVLRARGEGVGAAMGQGFAEAISKARGLVVLSGATLGGFAYDDPKRRNGVFTAAVLDGLHGGAEPGQGGWITVGTLAQYVQEQVVAWVRKEWPGHAERSLGIGKRIEASAEGLPLAPHPSATRERERYRERRTKALARVRELQGEVLSGAHWDQVRGLLPAEEPNAEAEKLLEEIEELDGGVRSQRGLRDYLREMAGEEAVVSPPPKAAALRPAESPPRPARRVVSPPPMGPSEPVPERQRAAVAERVKLRWGKPGSRAGIAVGGMLVGLLVLWLVVRLMDWPAPAAMPVKLPQVDSGSTTREPVPLDPVVSSRRTNSLGMNFLHVPRGTYTIGSPKGEAGRTDELELLPHDVTLTRGFWLGETEVTQGQWAQLVPNEAPWHFKACGANCPVENLTWYAALELANRMSVREGLTPCYSLDPTQCTGTLGGDYVCKTPPLPALDCPGYRLPTEAEWEVAARAGRRAPQATYAGNLTLRGEKHAPELDAIAWYGGNSGVTYADASDCSKWPDKQYSSTRCGPNSVAGKKSNPWSFHDMLGNVYEWTGDWYTEPTGKAFYPRDLDKGSSRVIRGGSWDADARYVRAAFRWGRPGGSLARDAPTPGPGAERFETGVFRYIFVPVRLRTGGAMSMLECGWEGDQAPG